MNHGTTKEGAWWLVVVDSNPPCIKMVNAKTYNSQNNYDDFCDINAETPLFCGLDYDKFNKTSLSFGPRAHTFGSMTKIRKSSWIVCDCDTFLKRHEIFVTDHHISCSVVLFISPHALILSTNSSMFI